MTEQWKPIIEFEDTYTVSNKGQIKRITKGTKFGAGHIYTGYITAKGYQRFCFNYKGRRYQRFAHVLVLEAFVGPCPPGMVTNHKNGNKVDNRLENLEWVTQAQNVKHSLEVLGNSHSRPGEQHGCSKLTKEQVKHIRRMFASGKYTKTELAREFGVTGVLIGLIVRRQAWKHV